MNIYDLERCFQEAKNDGNRYVAVKIYNAAMDRPEVFITQIEDFDERLELYKRDYTGDLYKKTWHGIKIIDFIRVNHYWELEDWN